MGRQTIRCSFCGHSNDEAGPMLEKADRQVSNRYVRICRNCAQMAIEAIEDERQRLGQGGDETAVKQ